MENNRNVSLTIGTSNVEVAQARNPTVKRIFFSLINTSTAAQIISVSFTDEAGAGNGIVLNAGGFYSESQDAGFTPTQGRIMAISSAAGGTLAVSERTVTG